MIDYAGIGYVQIDAGRIGGITRPSASRITLAARGVTYVNHTFTSHLALSASLQPFAGIEPDVICEYPVEPRQLALDITVEHLVPDAQGYINLPDRPGLGLTPSLAGIARVHGGCGDPRGRENALPHANALRQPSCQLDLDERWCRCARRRAGDRDWLRRPRRHSFGTLFHFFCGRNTLVDTRSYDQLRVSTFDTIGELAVAVADELAVVLRQAMAEQGEASAIFATGNSQLAFFQALHSRDDIAWNRVSIFHMDEQMHLSDQHPASFRNVLQKRLVDLVRPRAFYGIAGDTRDVAAELARYTALLESTSRSPVLLLRSYTTSSAARRHG